MAAITSSHEASKPLTTGANDQGDTRNNTVLSNNRDPTGAQSSAPTAPSTSHKARSRAICRFYQTNKGCRAADQCRFQHVARAEDEGNSSIAAAGEVGPHTKLPSRPRRTARSREVTVRPVSTAQQTDPRVFEIDQVIKRFAPTREDSDDGTLLSFSLNPSDPDFPFELRGGLKCVLKVPAAYPQSASPSLRVNNREMPKGYQINVERGFEALAHRPPPKKSLLALLNDLDRQLEQILTSEKAQTLKITANAPAPPPPPPPPPTSAPGPATQPSVQHVVPDAKPIVSNSPVFSTLQKHEAQAKRDADIRQLEARMGKMPLYSKSSDGTIYNIPLQVSKPSQLPPSLQPIKEIVLFVPALYNLEPCTVHLKGIESEESENVEAAFERYSRQNLSSTLMAHINYLAQNMRVMAAETRQPQRPITAQIAVAVADTTVITPSTERHAMTTEDTLLDTERPHLKLIARPPEWDRAENESGSSSDLTDSEEYSESTTDQEADGEGGAAVPAQAAAASLTTTTDRGVSISFPDVELYGIELLEVVSLALTLKCDRCKTVMDMSNLRPTALGNTVTVSAPCSKCAYVLSAAYRGEPVHAHNVRAGYLDLGSCTVQDMLPSVFAPTCSECSTRMSTPSSGGGGAGGVVSVRGDTTLSICRSCHQKMTFKLPSVKFLRESMHQKLLPALPRRRGPRENLGVIAGTPLPDNGRCSHYRKSYRWFRFSCCNKVFPCDRCHDDKAEPKHANEHANRMLCGWCSREQNYRPEDCGVCGRSMVAKKGGGFWEGGKGTRDPMRMSRKEPRKYKRIGAKNKAKENR